MNSFGLTKDTSVRRSVSSYKDGENWSEEKVIFHYEPLIQHLLKVVTRNLPEHKREYWTEDIKQDARLALLLRWRTYQSNKIECPFLTYAWLNIRGAMVDTFRNRRKETRNQTRMFTLDYDSWKDVLNKYCAYEVNIDDEIDVAAVLPKLELWERNLINMLYVEGETLKDIGVLGGVTESRVCQVHTQVLEKMRKLIADT